MRQKCRIPFLLLLMLMMMMMKTRRTFASVAVGHELRSVYVFNYHNVVGRTSLNDSHDHGNEHNNNHNNMIFHRDHINSSSLALQTYATTDGELVDVQFVTQQPPLPITIASKSTNEAISLIRFDLNDSTSSTKEAKEAKEAKETKSASVDSNEKVDQSVTSEFKDKSTVIAKTDREGSSESESRSTIVIANTSNGAEKGTADASYNIEVQGESEAEKNTSTSKPIRKDSLAVARQKFLMEKFRAIKIRPPKLRKLGELSQLDQNGIGMTKMNADAGTGRTWKPKIGYSSVARPRSVNYTRTASTSLNNDGHKQSKQAASLIKSNRDDQMELSGSEQQPLNLVLVHSYRRPAYERYASRLSFVNTMEAQGIPSSEVFGQLMQQVADRSKSPNIPKLLLPKANRPKMYSLNGFIPKPNVQKLSNSAGLIGNQLLTTTISPLNSLAKRSGLKKHSATRLNGLMSDHEDDKQYRKQSSNKGLSNDSDDLNASGSATRRRQIMFSKRKGYLNENSVEEKPNKNKNKRKLKAIDFQFPKANYPKELLESLKILPEAPKLEEPIAFRKLNANSIKSSRQDYPSYSEIPKTQFTCPENVASGVFADFDTQCQAWHMCQAGRKHSFLCANGTVFNERSGVCDWWYNVDCTQSQLNIVKMTSNKRPEVTVPRSVPMVGRRSDDESDDGKLKRSSSFALSSSESNLQPAPFINSNHPVLNPILIRNRNMELLNAAGSVARGLKVRINGYSLNRPNSMLRSKTRFYSN